MIDITKTYRTRCGYPVRIYATDGAGLYPIHGAYCEGEDWIVATWAIEGQNSLRNKETPFDLIEVKPRIQRDAWVNVYEHGLGGIHETKDFADFQKSPGRIACVHLTIDCEHGEGLEDGNA